VCRWPPFAWSRSKGWRTGVPRPKAVVRRIILFAEQFQRRCLCDSNSPSSGPGPAKNIWETSSFFGAVVGMSIRRLSVPRPVRRQGLEALAVGEQVFFGDGRAGRINVGSTPTRPIAVFNDFLPAVARMRSPSDPVTFPALFGLRLGRLTQLRCGKSRREDRAGAGGFGDACTDEHRAGLRTNCLLDARAKQRLRLYGCVNFGRCPHLRRRRCREVARPGFSEAEAVEITF